MSQAVTALVWKSRAFVRVRDDKHEAWNTASPLCNVSVWKHSLPLLSTRFFPEVLQTRNRLEIHKSPLFRHSVQCTGEVFWASISEGNSYLTSRNLPRMMRMLFPEGVFDETQVCFVFIIFRNIFSFRTQQEKPPKEWTKNENSPWWVKVLWENDSGRLIG